ncbi:creatininase [Acidocella sp. KAb 2-4]|uniref:creatininase n=1 Tax=Acidocella sp. KAb 2-4 TaxID=2885158 RepID=UPI001D07EF77|nr:creatininase [Acidocella sp. KAb 2-4]
MVDSVFMSDLSWQEFKQKISENVIVFLPLGATEQHGPHLPLSVDVVLPTGVCERVAHEVNGIVAPAIPYGCRSQPKTGGGESFPGTTSLDAHTFSLVVRDVVRQLVLSGVRRLVLVNGHFENYAPATEGVDLALRELRRDSIVDVKIVRLAYWDFITKETLDLVFPNGCPGIELEHASLMETSLMLLLKPELVMMEKIPSDGPACFPPYDISPVPENFVPASGVLAVAQGASVENGRLLFDEHVERIVATLRGIFPVG